MADYSKKLLFLSKIINRRNDQSLIDG